MEMSGQLYAPAALLTGKEPLVPIGLEVGWAPESVWTLMEICLSMNDELERAWKEAVVTHCKVLRQHFPGRTTENHGILQSEYSSVENRLRIKFAYRWITVFQEQLILKVRIILVA
jgi:hypothetical protein